MGEMIYSRGQNICQADKWNRVGARQNLIPGSAVGQEISEKQCTTTKKGTWWTRNGIASKCLVNFPSDNRGNTFASLSQLKVNFRICTWFALKLVLNTCVNSTRIAQHAFVAEGAVKMLAFGRLLKRQRRAEHSHIFAPFTSLFYFLIARSFRGCDFERTLNFVRQQVGHGWIAKQNYTRLSNSVLIVGTNCTDSRTNKTHGRLMRKALKAFKAEPTIIRSSLTQLNQAWEWARHALRRLWALSK